jgi:hypothetical protein
MRRHLSAAEVERMLTYGRSVEQWLGAHAAAGERIVRWVRLDAERSGVYSVTLFEVFDDGGPDFIDLYEFSPADADRPDGATRAFSEARAALELARTLGADLDRFVNAGVVQDEYANYVANRGSGN